MLLLGVVVLQRYHSRCESDRSKRTLRFGRGWGGGRAAGGSCGEDEEKVRSGGETKMTTELGRWFCVAMGAGRMLESRQPSFDFFGLLDTSVEVDVDLRGESLESSR